ncbi:MAG: choice-of-anchor B family protein [Bacteroidetes bacterium]|nr:choice-of-anchor B family protein [Bacteroidota bacterium]
MKKLAAILFFLVLNNSLLTGQSQDYPSEKIKLLSVSNPNKDSLLGQKYGGCWGWYQEDKQREYALIGGTNGTYFIDITNPSLPVVCDYVAGKYCNWREIKNFRNYCYVTTECGEGLKIIDMRYLPDSVHVVSTGTNVLYTSHTIWIDGNKLYCSSLRILPNANLRVGVFSLLNPEQPVFLHSTTSEFSFVGAHDLYSRHDTLYLSGGNNGIEVLKYDSINNKFNMLGTYSGYSLQGYNHSNFLTQNGKYLIFCDEIPAAQPIRIVDVSNLQNIQPASSFLPGPYTTPHNPYIIGNDWALISCYEDGLQIYEIKDPYNVKRAGFFDTYTLSGIDQGYYTGDYVGNYGAYPFLPSKTIITLDMNNGAFFLDASEAFGNIPPKKENDTTSACITAFTIPASQYVEVLAKAQSNGKIQLFSPEGQLIYSRNFSGAFSDKINTEMLPNGFYLLKVEGEDCRSVKKILITHK